MSFQTAGFQIIPAVLTASTCEEIIARLPDLDAAGSRSLLDLPWCRSLVTTLRKHAAISALLPADAVAVQCTLFDKSPEKNWLVAYHQDLAIPVSEAGDAQGYSAWSFKEGIHFVQPPQPVLESLVALRLHLDACGEADGPLRVLAGTHRAGRLESGQAASLRETHDEEVCVVGQGGAMLMRPLLLHASSKASGGRPRRVLHFLFGPPVLPCGVRWRRAI